jgi:fructokinase
MNPYRIGIDLGGTKIEGLLLNPEGVEQGRVRKPTPQGDYQGTLNTIFNIVQELETGLDSPARVGVGIPGIVSPATGLVKNANSVCLIGHPLDRDLERMLGRSVRLENDANCFAVSEAVDGAGKGAGVVFGVILGTGCGGGIVVDGRVIPGKNAVGGEWGHNPLPWPTADENPGPRCYCGKNGCVETFLSGPGLSNDFFRAAGSRHTPEELVSMAVHGSFEAEQAIQRYETRLAKALAVVINILDPDVIVLGGGMSNIQRLYKNVPPLLQDWVFSDAVSTPLRPARHGDSSGVRGAAWL